MAKKKKPDQEKTETDVVEDTSAEAEAPETTDLSEPLDSDDVTDDVDTEYDTGDAETAADDVSDETEMREDADSADDTDDASTLDDILDPEPEKQIVERVIETRGGFGTALLGGAAAAILGFVAGRADLIDPLLPPSWRSADNSAAIAALETDLSKQSQSVADLGNQVNSLEIPDMSPVRAAIEDLSSRTAPIGTQVNALGEKVDAFEARLNEIEKRPMSEGVSQGAIEAYERELARLQETVATQRTEVEALIESARSKEANANEAARLAAAQTAVARLRASLDDGVPFAVAAQDLATLGVSMPDPLPSVKDEGVATLAALQSSFPPAARTALATVRDIENGGESGLGAFLRRQLGARSVAPRDGDDADAVLSRAQAAVTDGQLATALNEISSLPEGARSVMSEWTATAQKRLDAVRAAETLAQSLTPN